MEVIDFSAFISFPTPSKMTSMAITVPNSERINFNQKAMLQIPSRIELCTSADGQTLVFREYPEAEKALPKNGSMKFPKLIEYLTAHGVRLPARYEITQAENGWIARRTDSCIPNISDKFKKPKISKQTAEKLIKEIHSL